MGTPAIKIDSPCFSYKDAFDRNIGWLTNEDQSKLRTSTVAIAGLGGAGGYQAQALARLGVGRFKVADLDTFELSNTNRQMGADIHTLGHAKVDTIKNMILSINPEAEVEIFGEGIQPNNIDEFLEGVDVALDGVDFFTLDTKMLLFDACYKKGIPAITSCPLGFGASVLVFDPEGMTYRHYFDLNDKMNDKEKRFAFAYGLSPSPLCLGYMHPEAVNMDGSRAASVASGLMLVGALSSTEAVKILTGKGRVRACPSIFQIDLRTQKTKRKYYRFGMKSPWQRLKKKIIISCLPQPKNFSR